MAGRSRAARRRAWAAAAAAVGGCVVAGCASARAPAPGPGGALDALAVSGGSALSVFRLTPAGAWQQTQVISVPVQLGSSS